MPEPLVFFDESGNTGADLLNADQPVFTLASTNLDRGECETLLKIVESQAPEAKFSRLSKTPRGRQALIRLYDELAARKDQVKHFPVHKRYMVLGKMIDLFEEPQATAHGVNLYERGANIALCNLHFFCLPTMCGEAPTKQFLASFVNLVRRPDADSTERYAEAAIALYEECRDEEYRSMLSPYVMAIELLEELLDGILPRDLDPAIPALFGLCANWGDTIGGNFQVMHDSSAPIASEKGTIEAFMDPAAQSNLFGCDRWKFKLPLKATGIQFGDSKAEPQLQLADLVAGAVSFLLTATCSANPPNEFAQALLKSKLMQLATGALWPSQDFTPKDLETEGMVGQDSLEWMTERLESLRRTGEWNGR